MKVIYTIDNIRELSKPVSPVIRQRVSGSNSKIYYRLVAPLTFKLTNGDVITIPRGFEWDLSSVPRFLWGILPPDGDMETPSILHDYLYMNKLYSREFADREMLLWSKATSGTLNKWSIRNIDNQIRYIAVRSLGWYVWNKRKPFTN